MIVYRVQRGWYQFQVAADKARIAAGLKPGAVQKVEVKDRDDLCALLNALCHPSVKTTPQAPATVALVEEAFVDPHLDIDATIPRFLLREHHEREERMAKLHVHKGDR
jgi:hypothetical protein